MLRIKMTNQYDFTMIITSWQNKNDRRMHLVAEKKQDSSYFYNFKIGFEPEEQLNKFMHSIEIDICLEKWSFLEFH